MGIIEWWMPHPVMTYINEHKRNGIRAKVRTKILHSTVSGTVMLWIAVLILAFIPT